MKTFPIHMKDGRRIDARQLGTFAYYLQNVQYRFVVTQLPGDMPAVTHRKSGMRVTSIPFIALQAALGDAVAAGKDAMRQLVESKGEARVASVIRAAEA